MHSPTETCKRAYLSSKDYNSILIFKCDGCHLIKPNLRVFADKKEKGYLCEYCFTQ